VPAADPNTPSQIHRLMKLQGMVAIAGMPQFQGIADNRRVYHDVMEFLTGRDPTEYTLPPQAAAPPPPDPKIVAAQIKAGSDQEVAESHLQETRETNQQKSSDAQLKAINDEANRQSDEARAAMALKGKALETLHSTANASADRAQDQAQHVDQMNKPEQTSQPNNFSGPQF
jgi:type IV secretory pathway VirB10-like protein